MNKKLGRQLWNILHSFTKLYPDEPTKADKTSAKRFFGGFLELVYGASNGCECGRDLQLMLTLSPPPLDSRQELEDYAVAIHDAVNAKLQKPIKRKASQNHPVFKVMGEKLASPGGERKKCPAC